MRYYYVYLEVKNKENEFYWNILTKWFNRHQGFESITMYRDASLLYLFVEARMPTDMSTTLSNNDQAELNQYKVFSLIKTLIDLVNNTQTTTISSDRFRFGFGMAYYYFYLYAEATQVFGTAEQLKNLLSGQRDTLQVADPTKIGLQGFAKFANKYSTDRSVSFNSSSLDNHKKAEQALLSSRHKEFKVQPLQQENTSILDNSAKDSESYLRDNPNLLVGIIVIIVVGGYILYHLKVKDTSVDTNNTKKRATNNSSANDQQSSTKKLSTHEAVKEQDQQSSTKNPSTYEEVKEHEEQPTDDNSAVHKLFNAFGTFFFAVLLLMIISVLVGLLLRRKRKGK
jgi:ABC-type sugar transport system permease subunit